ncbi:MAG: hypothetical protein QNK37_00105 [Acidobacteriota bacterium]|nr:hypothetical protein [Acidobacteriota bacterium]
MQVDAQTDKLENPVSVWRETLHDHDDGAARQQTSDGRGRPHPVDETLKFLNSIEEKLDAVTRNQQPYKVQNDAIDEENPEPTHVASRKAFYG